MAATSGNSKIYSSMAEQFNQFLSPRVMTGFNVKLQSICLSLSVFYGLPKANKGEYPVRPIISTLDSYQYQLSKYLGKGIREVRPQASSYIKDTSNIELNKEFVDVQNTSKGLYEIDLCRYKIIEMKKLNDKKEFEKAIDLFSKYEEKSNETLCDLSVNQVLKSFTNRKDFQGGLNIHQRYLSRIEKNSFILASLIHFYMEFGNVNVAEELFKKSKNKTVGMYGAMMKGYIKNSLLNKAIEIFFKIENPDEINYVLLLNACSRIGTEETLNIVKKILLNLPNSYQNNKNILTTAFDAFIKCNDLSNAEKIFPKIKQTVISYGNLMKFYNKNNQEEKTLNLYKQMIIDDNIQLDPIIYVHLINAAAHIGILSISNSIYKQIPKCFLQNIFIKNALIDMWGKSGDIKKAKDIFQSLTKPDTIGYTSMINSYGLNGMAIEAIELFNKTPEEFILEETCVSILNACSHAGLVDHARSIFNNINNKTDKIYTTMVDCLSRSSLFEEALKLIDHYESDHSPSPTMLMSLLSAARNRKNKELSEKIFNRIKGNFPELKNRLISASILLSNVYASIGEIKKSSNIRNKLYQQGLRKISGLSFTEINGKIFKFRAHDQTHPRSKEIYDEVQKISKELIEYGHQYDASWITRGLNENETIESNLCGHSERLAIAWNFIENPNIRRIQITKNLRICGDCRM
ncbi:unnamed protein product [Adineta steineri]|uniref:DYW domain-containing protein n=1 Tax=Adineta steineri TaxID=433720 RepID=A0A815RM01_9BILA|nr:unnamed protein product [Adineta steineri]CAF1637871.1 unnamed protein product [Adineta steineri]